MTNIGIPLSIFFNAYSKTTSTRVESGQKEILSFRNSISYFWYIFSGNFLETLILDFQTVYISFQLANIWQVTASITPTRTETYICISNISLQRTESKKRYSINCVSHESTKRSQEIGNPKLNSNNTISIFERPKMYKASITLLYLGLLT